MVLSATQKDKLAETFIVPAISAVTGVGILRFGFGETGTIPAFGYQLPMWAGAGGAIAASNLVSETFGNYIMGFVPKGAKWFNVANTVAQPLAAGLATFGIINVGRITSGESVSGLVPALVSGRGGTVIGEYTYQKAIKQFIAK